MRLLPAPQIWSLKSWDEVPAGEIDNPPSNTWAMIRTWDQEVNGTAGTSVKVNLELREINFCKAVNDQNPGFWRWADHPAGTVYFGEDWKTDIRVKWAVIMMASSSRLNVRNFVIVDAFSDDGSLVRVQAIPRSTDYSRYLHDPNYVQRVFDQGGYNACDGLPTSMPMFDPTSGFVSNAKGIWFRPIWKYALIGELPLSTSIPGVGEVIISYRGTDWIGRVKNLNIRPTPSMYNTEVGYVYPATHIDLDAIVETTEGVWGKISNKLWIALYLKSNNTYYTTWRP
jgi:hypothetical protein